MGLNFRKSLSIGKYLKLNFSKAGIGASAGVKGARVSLNKDGLRQTFSLPGTGLSWTERQSFKKRKAKNAAAKASGKWKTYIWIALVMGVFFLYQSGALDPTIAKVRQAFTGSGETINALPSAPTPAAMEAEQPVSSAVSATGQVPIDAPAETDPAELMPREIKLKDTPVILSEGTKYVASKSGTKFHDPKCRVVQTIVSTNLVEYASREEAAEKKEPCSVCSP